MPLVQCQVSGTGGVHSSGFQSNDENKLLIGAGQGNNGHVIILGSARENTSALLCCLWSECAVFLSLLWIIGIFCHNLIALSFT